MVEKGCGPPLISPSEDKRRMFDLLGFDNEKSFNKWRNSRAIKPVWDLFVTKFLETDLFDEGQQMADWRKLQSWIAEGEASGKARFWRAMPGLICPPAYDNELDWHAWFIFWFVEMNKSLREGCFFGKRLDNEIMLKKAWSYVVWAKWHHKHDPEAAQDPNCPGKALESSDSDSEVEEVELDPNRGTASVRWIIGVPDALEDDNRIFITEFCGYSMIDFYNEVENRFDLSKHKQRRVRLFEKTGLNFRKAQIKAQNTGKMVYFILKTVPW